MQEYFYLLVTTAWGMQASYGSASTEWPYTAWSDLSACNRNPRGVDLYNNVISKIFSAPSTATLTSLGTLASGGTPDASPCPLSIGTTTSSCCCTCTTGCVAADTPTGTALSCTKTGCSNTETAFTWSKVCATTPDTCSGNVLMKSLFMMILIFILKV